NVDDPAALGAFSGAPRRAAATAADRAHRHRRRAPRREAVGAMIPYAYLDSSVVLRLLLGQPDALAEWEEIEAGVASALVEVECLRTLDRVRVMGAISDDDLAERRAAVFG